MTPQEILAAGKLMAKEKHPYFRAAIDALVPRQTPGLGTLGVTDKGVLMWDPAAVSRWGVKHTAAVVVHEVSHLLRDHPGRCEMAHANPKGFNIAGDMEINDDLLQAGWELPDEPALPKNIGMEDGKTAEEYYAKLRELAEQAQKEQQQPGNGPPKPSKGGQQPGTGEGESGDQPQEQESDNGKGNERNSSHTSPSKPEKKSKKEAKGGGSSPPKEQPKQERHPQPQNGGGGGGNEASGSGEGQGEDSSTLPGSSPGSSPSQAPEKPKVGGGWCGSCAGNPLPDEPKEDKDGRSKADLQRVRREVAEAVREAASRSRGSVPGGWARWAEDFSKPPKIPWQQKLARFARAAVAYRPGAGDFTYRKPSRRQGGIGFGAGRPVLPAMHSPKPEAAIIVDTSGSMGTAQLETAIREARGILLACGTGVTFLACDAEVHAMKPVKHWKEMLGLMKGGGGTNMRPAFEEVSKMRKRPDVVICITDGYIGDPGPEPRDYKVIWLSVAAPDRFAEWGEFVYAEPVEEAA